MSKPVLLPMTDEGLSRADAIVESDQLERAQKISDVWNNKKKDAELIADLEQVMKRFG